MRRVVRWLAGQAGFVLVRRHRWAGTAALNCRLLAQVCAADVRMRSAMTADGIVFSKDRPLQLHALLSSYFDRVKNGGKLHVIFRPTSERYARCYEELRREFSGRPVDFHLERAFRNDVIRIVMSIATRSMLFLVDDDVFVADVDMAALARLDPARCIPSLRLGRSLRFCYTENRRQPLPPFGDPPEAMAGETYWRWRDGAFDWGYPLSIDGHMFSTSEMQAMVTALEFRSPSSLEGALQGFHDCFSDRWGMCCNTSRLVNIPDNRVQDEAANRTAGGDAEALLAAWEQGYRVDCGKLYGHRPSGAHEAIPLPLTAGRHG